MFRQMLMNSAARILRAPEDDQGAQGDFDPLDDFTDDVGDDLDDDADGGFEGDDDSGDDADDDDAGEDEPPARRAKPESRAEKRLKALAAENADIRRQLAAITTPTPQAGPSAEEQQRREEQHLATLTAEEQVRYLLNKQAQNTNAALQGVQFQIADMADRSEFTALCNSKPALAKMATKVEETLAEMRKGGNTAPRSTVAAWLIGQQVLAGKSNAPKQRQQAAANRDRQEARPTGGRSDARPASGKTTDKAAREKRLLNQNI